MIIGPENYILMISKTFTDDDKELINNEGINFIGNLTSEQIMKMLEKIKDTRDANDESIQMSVKNNKIITEINITDKKFEIDEYSCSRCYDEFYDEYYDGYYNIHSLKINTCNGINNIFLPSSISDIEIVNCGIIQKLCVKSDSIYLTLELVHIANLNCKNIDTLQLNQRSHIRRYINDETECKRLEISKNCNISSILASNLNFNNVYLESCNVNEHIWNKKIRKLSISNFTLDNVYFHCESLLNLNIDASEIYDFTVFNECKHLRTLYLSNINSLINISNSSLLLIHIIKCKYIELKDITVKEVIIDDKSTVRLINANVLKFKAIYSKSILDDFH